MPAGNQGLTLVEVLVSIAIFAVLSVAVLSTLPGILKVNRQSRDDQGVTVVGKAYLENVRAKWNDPTATIDPTNGSTTTAGQTNFDAEALPPMPASTSMNGYTCTNALSNQVTSPTEAGGVHMVKRLTMTCTLTGQPTQIFTVDLERPL
ncbi:prepilin-type N-terminal cleavage/methylation domain-containing protein [Deinococcus sp.]|uniref:PulJ/GspJ family protein n=1 Tax=Deinococcus sp. TaxID=47478 RepID=UPI0028699C23|nr:prepilin-type N-terminal cleavage/methylation domain-containing protein [Deinococcus sp.]